MATKREHLEFQLHSRLDKALRDLMEERAMNKSLTRNQEEWHTKVADLEKRIDEKNKVIDRKCLQTNSARRCSVPKIVPCPGFTPDGTEAFRLWCQQTCPH